MVVETSNVDMYCMCQHFDIVGWLNGGEKEKKQWWRDEEKEKKQWWRDEEKEGKEGGFLRE